MQDYTFLWHDYETFGVQARRDRPAQFAAIRTDAELNEIGEPIMLYCQPAPDFLPDPQSCLITGITPQLCLERGIPEHQFAAKIEQEFSQSGTIGVGYNTIRFDDEITRFMFWRNLIDPYAREWQNNCGRWDLLDVVRTTYALRPEGINWPVNDDGKPSFRLELLTAANGLAHDAAHDALSDVRATIALARLIRQHQPKLFEFCLALRKKERVATEIGLPLKKAFLHVSGMIPAERGCITAVWPLATHPHNKNEVIVWDLNFDPSELFTLDAASIRQRMFSKADALPEGVTRLPVKSIHLNKSPVVISNLKTLSPQRAEHWGLDMQLVQAHAQLAELAEARSDMSGIWQQIFSRDAETGVDVDEDLYGGFIGNNDRRTLNDLRAMNAQQLTSAHPHFQDGRLEELLFRYRARNFPHSLSADEQQLWEQHRAARLLGGAAKALTVEQFFDRIDTLQESASERDEEILGALYDYAEQITPVR
ncbi:exodeoxyribonuclease I [Undibacterium piscinae]|uniref:Exodeoxyribonuclease I n=1 Tax=Undibacterium piscinae TaxID=2495591 RepID=A0A6M4A502_9BURK|nr:exodeoxyribonuclease I [Undibacterium piscinae]